MKKTILSLFLILVFFGTANGADFIMWDAPVDGGAPDGYFINFTDGTSNWNSGNIGNVTEYDMAPLNIPYNVPITYTIVAFNINSENPSDPIIWTRPGFTPPGQLLPPPGQTKPGKPGNPKTETR